jgi:RimJ/RimL family protein N-acetyltransferase
VNLRTTDINEFEALVGIAEALPESERQLFTALTGATFDAEQFLISLAEMLGDMPYQYIFWADDKAVAAGGFLPERPGVYRTWFMAPQTTWDEHGRDLTEACKKLVADMFEGRLAHRIETVTLADRTEARAWYERIGLTFESTLCGYGAHGEDAVMYVAVRKQETH